MSNMSTRSALSGIQRLCRPVKSGTVAKFSHQSLRSVGGISKPTILVAATTRRQSPQTPCKRSFSWDGHGTDLLSDSLAHNYGVPKIILNGHSDSGFDVVNMVKNKDTTGDEALKATGGIVHCAGSVLAFPNACYLWKVRSIEDLTVESLAPVLLHRPSLEYLLLGSADPIPPQKVQEIREALQRVNEGVFGNSNNKIVVEPMDLTNAMGTFDILNGEDRQVAAALILPEEEED